MHIKDLQKVLDDELERLSAMFNDDMRRCVIEDTDVWCSNGDLDFKPGTHETIEISAAEAALLFASDRLDPIIGKKSIQPTKGLHYDMNDGGEVDVQVTLVPYGYDETSGYLIYTISEVEYA